MKRIPKKLQIGHWFIKITQVSEALMEDISTTSDACWSINLAMDTEHAGTIYIRNDLTPKEKWSGLYHELVHAVHDIDYYYNKFGVPGSRNGEDDEKSIL